MGTMLDESPWLSFLILGAAKGFVLLVIMCGIALVTRRLPAPARHALWAVGLGGLLLLPALSLQFSWVELPVTWKATSAPIVVETPQPVSPALGPNAEPGAVNPIDPRASIRLPETPAPVVQPESEPASSAATLLITLWVAGALICLVPYGLGRLALRQLAKEAAPLTTPEWIAALENASRPFRLRRKVSLLSSQEDVVPMTWGLLRPTILLPRCAKDWDATRRDIVVQHELAHVARWDCMTDLAGILARALHWFNPLVWLGVRRLYAERETACDEWVLQGGVQPSLYAHHLLEIVRGLDKPKLVTVAGLAMGRSSRLELRMKAILCPRLTHRFSKALGAAAFAVVAASVLSLAGLQPLLRATAQEDTTRITVIVKGNGPEGTRGKGEGSVTIQNVPRAALDSAGSEGIKSMSTDQGQAVSVTVDSYDALKRVAGAMAIGDKAPTVAIVLPQTTDVGVLLDVISALQLGGIKEITVSGATDATTEMERLSLGAIRTTGRSGGAARAPMDSYLSGEKPGFGDLPLIDRMKYMGLYFKMYANDDAEGEFFPPRSVEAGAFYPKIDAIYPKYAKSPDVVPFLKSQGDVRVAYTGFVLHDEATGLRFLDAYEELRSNALSEAKDVEYRGVRIMRIREGIERFFITDINNPAASAIAQAQIPIMWTMPDDEKGGYVLYMDGHVEYVYWGRKFPMTETFILRLNKVMQPPPT